MQVKISTISTHKSNTSGWYHPDSSHFWSHIDGVGGGDGMKNEKVVKVIISIISTHQSNTYGI